RKSSAPRWSLPTMTWGRSNGTGARSPSSGPPRSLPRPGPISMRVLSWSSAPRHRSETWNTWFAKISPAVPATPHPSSQSSTGPPVWTPLRPGRRADPIRVLQQLSILRRARTSGSPTGRTLTERRPVRDGRRRTLLENNDLGDLLLPHPRVRDHYRTDRRVPHRPLGVAPGGRPQASLAGETEPERAPPRPGGRRPRHPAFGRRDISALDDHSPGCSGVGPVTQESVSPPSELKRIPSGIPAFDAVPQGRFPQAASVVVQR